MVRSIVVNTLFHDHFNVLAADDLTKVSGLTQVTDFVATVFRDGVVIATPPTITIVEIGVTGEYDLSFTPDQIGYWEVHVETTTQTPDRRYEGTYDVIADPDGALTNQIFHDRVVDDRGNAVPFVTVEVFEANTANLLATTETNFAGEYQLLLSGILATAILTDLRFSGGGIVTFTKSSVRLNYKQWFFEA